jgi:hypothetical protein
VVYVETWIAAKLDHVWRLTRDPAQHERWDLRFTTIEPYGPDGRFRYATRVLPGLTIAGVGVTVGEHDRADGTATSALRFGSGHPLSLVRSGSGYWRYRPAGTGVVFVTGYDYRPGWGRYGALADRLFRPVFSWATAWSFDRLRLWAERGVPPERSRNQALAEVALRLGAVTAALATFGPTAALASAVLLVLLPPLPGTPAARRCRYRVWATRPEKGAS